MGLLNNDILQSGGWTHYAGASPAASGVSSFANNFLQAYMGMQENERKKQEAEYINQLRHAQAQALMQKEQGWSDPFEKKVGGKTVLFQQHKSTGELKRLSDDKPVTNITVGGYGTPVAKDIAKQRFSNLSKLEEGASQAQFKVEQYNNLINQLDKGNVGGFQGGVKAMFAPYMEAAGIQGFEQAGEAQAFKLISRALIGDMRLEIVGPGPISDKEQELLERMSGGNINVARTAARDLFKMYKGKAASKIKMYNLNYDLLSKKHPEIKEYFIRYDDKTGVPMTSEKSFSAPPNAVQYLRSNPNLAADFDKKYGEGASKYYLGGR